MRKLMNKETHIREIHIHNLDQFEILKALKQDPKNEYCMLLDSSMYNHDIGKYSFLSFNPHTIIYSKNHELWINDIKEPPHTNPLLKFQELLDLHKNQDKHQENPENPETPLSSGAIGFMAYDMYIHTEPKVPAHQNDPINFLDMFFAFSVNIITINHETGLAYVNEDIADYVENTILNYKNKTSAQTLNQATPPSKDYKFTSFKNIVDKQSYTDAINNIKDNIKNGEIYQANYTQLFETSCIKNQSKHKQQISSHMALDIYHKLRRKNKAPFSAYLDLEDHGKILSSSPERFIKVSHNNIETRPIKGTIARDKKNKHQDDINKNTLLSSEKDKAELLMIVDLERNDLSKVSEAGSVKVENNFKLETYETVHHLVSTVKGKLKNNTNIYDILKATFPGGSITGTPKRRSMEIINNLETQKRGVYTGLIGWYDYHNNFDSSIVIRTIIIKDNKAYIQSGGGITWDSLALMEYEESLLKSQILKEIFNND